MSEKGRPFEASLAELEKVVRDLEEGDLGLDETLARYECGIALVRECHGRLREAEQRITVLNNEP
jgi:exodeoxyribonuclease VII small subunit